MQKGGREEQGEEGTREVKKKNLRNKEDKERKQMICQGAKKLCKACFPSTQLAVSGDCGDEREEEELKWFLFIFCISCFF
jgi:hypothetical protein